MKTSLRTLNLLRIGICGVIALTLPMACRAPYRADTATSVSDRLAQDLIGTWVHVGSPGQVMEVPTKGGRFKSRTGTHWSLTTADPETGLVTEHFGGTYTLNGKEYIETQAYADSTWLHDNEKSFKFLVTVEGDTMTQIGVGNPYNEVWKRVR